MEWQRPENIKFPTVWSRFEGKPHGDRTPYKYIIQDVTEDLMEAVVDHMVHYFLVRENIVSTVGFLEDKVSTGELRELWRHALEQRVGLVALVESEETEGEMKIAGVNMTLITDIGNKETEKAEFEKKIKGTLWSKTYRTLSDLEKDVDIPSQFGTTKYMTAYGLSVAPQYHGDGVGYQLLMARTPLCRAIGIDLTVTAFTGATSQYLATKAGFKTIASLDYTKYKHDEKLAYPRLEGSCLLMAKRIPAEGD